MQDVFTDAPSVATWWYRRAQGKGFLPITNSAAALLASDPDACRNEGVEIRLARYEDLEAEGTIHPAVVPVIAARPEQQHVADFLTTMVRRPVDHTGANVGAELGRWPKHVHATPSRPERLAA